MHITSKVHRLRKLAFLADPVGNASMTLHRRRIARLRRVVDDPVLEEVLDFFGQNTGLVAYHMRVFTLSDKTTVTLPALPATLPPASLYLLYKFGAKGGDAAAGGPAAGPASRVSRSTFSKLYDVYYSGSQHATAALAAMHVEGTLSFQQMRELLVQLGEKTGHLPFQRLTVFLVQVRWN